MIIEEKISLGKVIIRIITEKEPSEILEKLKEIDIRSTCVNAEGSQGPVKIIFSVLSRRKISAVEKLIEAHIPKAFYTIEGVKTVSDDISQGGSRLNYFKRVFPKGKFK